MQARFAAGIVKASTAHRLPLAWRPRGRLRKNHGARNRAASLEHKYFARVLLDCVTHATSLLHPAVRSGRMTRSQISQPAAPPPPPPPLWLSLHRRYASCSGSSGRSTRQRHECLIVASALNEQAWYSRPRPSSGPQRSSRGQSLVLAVFDAARIHATKALADPAPTSHLLETATVRPGAAPVLRTESELGFESGRTWNADCFAWALERLSRVQASSPTLHEPVRLRRSKELLKRDAGRRPRQWQSVLSVLGRQTPGIWSTPAAGPANERQQPPIFDRHRCRLQMNTRKSGARAHPQRGAERPILNKVL